jgi:ribonuclease Y
VHSEKRGRKVQPAVFVALGVVAGAAVVVTLTRWRARRLLDAATRDSEALLAAARGNAERLRRAAADAARAAVASERRAAQREADEARAELARHEESLNQRDTLAADRERTLAETEDELKRRAEGLTARDSQVAGHAELTERTRKHERETLLVKAESTREEVVHALVEELVAKAEHEIDLLMRQEESALEADRAARHVMGVACERRDAGLQTGKVSGGLPLSLEGAARLTRGDRPLLAALGDIVGVKPVLAESGDMIHFEGQDPLEREVAKRAIEFVQRPEGARVGPAGLARLVTDIRAFLETDIMKLGEQAFRELRLQPAQKPITRLVGVLNWRFSFGQNQWKHAIETAWLASMMADELKVDTMLARRGALLHDIGKSMTHAMDGGHAVIGADFARQYQEPEVVANAIGAHHGEEPPNSPIARLVAAADAMSGARPGARRESTDVYVERIEGLERIAGSMHGVEAAFALQAGREVRLYVAAGRVSDADAVELSRAVADKIEQELTYPGQIKVTVIRETRAVAVAG